MEFCDLRQTREWAEYLRKIGWKIEKFSILNFSTFAEASADRQFSNYLYIRKIPLTPFSIAKLQRASGEVDFKNVEKLCRKNRVVRLYVEPLTKNRLSEFKKCMNGFLPCRTLQINLNQSEGKILQKMKSKTRYNILVAKKRGVEVRVVGGRKLAHSPLLFRTFLAMLQENAKRLKIFGMPEKWLKAQVMAFGDKCFVALAYPSTGSGLVAGNFLMTSKDGCFYSHNGSTGLGRKMMAPTLCAWEAVREAKRRNLKVFDFDGIDDGTRALKRWKGFTRFKKGFGGKEIEFAAMRAKWLWPF